MNTVERRSGAFKRAVLFACYDALEAAGFTRFRKEGVDWPLEGGFHCWVGLNNNLEGDYLQVNPFVGVHAVPIMKLYTSLEGRKYSRSIATYAVHVGKLVPAEDVFRFSRKKDFEEEATRLARLYATIGLSYSQSIASYEELLPLLQDRVPMLGAYPERVAACLYLMDRKEEARAFTEDFVKAHREYFEGFAEPFLKLLAE